MLPDDAVRLPDDLGLAVTGNPQKHFVRIGDATRQVGLADDDFLLAEGSFDARGNDGHVPRGNGLYRGADKAVGGRVCAPGRGRMTERRPGRGRTHANGLCFWPVSVSGAAMSRRRMSTAALVIARAGRSAARRFVRVCACDEVHAPRRCRNPLRHSRAGRRAAPVRAPRLPERARGDRGGAPRHAAHHGRDRRAQRRDDRAPRVQRAVAPLRAHVLQGQQGAARPARVFRTGARARHALQRNDRRRPRELLLHHDVRPLRRCHGLHARRHHPPALRQGGARPRARRRDWRDGSRRVGAAVHLVARRGTQGLPEVSLAQERARRPEDRARDDTREDAHASSIATTCRTTLCSS